MSGVDVATLHNSPRHPPQLVSSACQHREKGDAGGRARCGMLNADDDNDDDDAAAAAVYASGGEDWWSAEEDGNDWRCC
jgi:hypothetical protein